MHRALRKRRVFDFVPSYLKVVEARERVRNENWHQGAITRNIKPKFQQQTPLRTLFMEVAKTLSSGELLTLLNFRPKIASQMTKRPLTDRYKIEYSCCCFLDVSKIYSIVSRDTDDGVDLRNVQETTTTVLDFVSIC